jgi:hypothetical protein
MRIASSRTGQQFLFVSVKGHSNLHVDPVIHLSPGLEEIAPKMLNMDLKSFAVQLEAASLFGFQGE